MSNYPKEQLKFTQDFEMMSMKRRETKDIFEQSKNEAENKVNDLFDGMFKGFGDILNMPSSKGYSKEQVCELLDEASESFKAQVETDHTRDDVINIVFEYDKLNEFKIGKGLIQEVKPSLELGKVYINNLYELEMFFISSFEDCNSYGFNANGRWSDNQQLSESEVIWKVAPDGNWQEALTKEAEKRGHEYQRYQWHDPTSCFMGTNEVSTESHCACWTTLLNVKGIWLEADEIEETLQAKCNRLAEFLGSQGITVEAINKALSNG